MTKTEKITPAFQRPQVAEIFEACSAPIRDRLLNLRSLIFEVASELPVVGDIEETLL